jgi:hypothetical protein
MKLILTRLAITISCQSIFAIPFKDGYYYTKEGKKVEGLIKFRRATFSLFGSKQSSILFKENKDSAPIKLTPDDISSFVIGNDSFTLVYNIKINSIQGEYAKDFAKVVVSGRMNLFTHMSSSSNGTTDYDIDSYVFSKDNKNYLGVWNVKKQREEIAELFSADPELKTRILNKEFDKKIPELVKEYNSKMN